MSTTKLTDAQKEPLFALVRHQRQVGEDVVFAWWCGVDQVARIGPFESDLQFEPFSPSDLHYVGPDDRPRRESVVVIAKTPIEVIDLWHDKGHVNPGKMEISMCDGPSVSTFILCQEALDYESRMRKPWLVRNLLDVMDAWATDLRALIVAVVAAVLTTIVLNWLTPPP